jgi:hypothetical protein
VGELIDKLQKRRYNKGGKMEENFIEKLLNDLRQDRNIRGDSEKWANWMSGKSFTV